MPEIFNWNEDDIAKLIEATLDDRKSGSVNFDDPSATTLAKLARWGKASALYERRRFPTHSIARPMVASMMSDLYIGMDLTRRALEDHAMAVPNDETLARMGSLVGEMIRHGKTPLVAFADVLTGFAQTPGAYQVADGGKPFEMADFNTLNHP